MIFAFSSVNTMGSHNAPHVELPSYNKYKPENGLINRNKQPELCVIDYILKLRCDCIKLFRNTPDQLSMYYYFLKGLH